MNAIFRKSRRTGFSLIEVVMAIGVVSFAFVSVLGLVPLGMNNFRNSIDVSVGARIGQQLVNQIQETDFTSVALLSGSVTYFDVDGEQMTGANPTGWVYEARTAVVVPSPALPGSAANDSMATVTVQIANNPGGGSLQVNPMTNLWMQPAGVSMKTFSTMVSGCTLSGT